MSSKTDALHDVQIKGWRSSAVQWSRVQTYPDAPCIYQGSCSGHGENLIGVCYCGAGFADPTVRGAADRTRCHRC